MPRGFVGALLVGVLLISAGCEALRSDARGGSRWPPAAAGRACQLLDFETVAEHIGTRFDTAGGASQEETHTCALTLAGHDYPDLTLAITATEADEVIFTVSVVPSGSTAVTGLGRIAYQIGAPPSANAGPGVEVGWLSISRRLMILRYTFGPGATAEQVDEITPKLIALAKRIDQPPATSAP